MRISKRESVSLAAAALGMTRLLEWFARRPCLLALNYHRLGDHLETDDYDPALVEATAAEFDSQVGLLKKRFHLVDLAEAQDLAADPSRLRHTHVLITFDDGYRDNHDIALPILRSHGAPAAFFLVTGFVGTHRVPWWDQVAFMIRRTRGSTIRLGYPRPAGWDLAALPLERVIGDVLRLYTHRDTVDPERFLGELEVACEIERPREMPERLFMSWDEARALVDAGLGIGSHTHRHEVLAKLSPEEQLEECRRSREVILEKLGIGVDALAYPIGSRASFSDVTVRCLRETGYRTAFSYYGGVNVPPSVAPLDVARISVDRASLPLYRLNVGLAAVRGWRISVTARGAETSVRIEVHPWRSWSQLSSQWTDLADEAPESGFFLSRAWVETWIEIFGAQLRPRILVFRGGAGVVGICLIVFRTRFRGPVPVRRVYLNAAGEDEEDDTCPEYNRILCLPGFERVVESVLGTWLAAEGWDEFVANALTDELVLPPLEGCEIIRREVNCYYVDATSFPPTLDGFLSRLSRNAREQLRRSIRLFQERGELRVQAAESVEQAEAFLTELAALHETSWTSRGKPGVFASSRFFMFHRRLIAKLFAAGGIKLLRVVAGETTIAVLYLFVRSGKVMFYQSGLEQVSDNRLKPGLVAHALAIAELAAGGMREYDFLAGESQYKKSLSTGSRSMMWLIVQRRGVKFAAIDLLKQVRARLTRSSGTFASLV